MRKKKPNHWADSAVDSVYEDLANAIIIQAVYDYREAVKLWVLNPHDKRAKANVAVLEKFFLSDWCSILTSAPMRDVMLKVKEEVKAKYG